MYLFNKKIIAVLCFALISSLHGADKGTVQKVRDRSGKLVELRLPFPYKHLMTCPETGLPLDSGVGFQENSSSESTVFLPELFYAVLGKNSVIHSAFVGPCSPCLAIGIRDEARDKTVVLHGQLSPFVNRITDIIDKELGETIEDPRIKIFTTTTFKNDQSHKDRIGIQRQFLSYLESVLSKRYLVAKKSIEVICYSQLDTHHFFLQAADVNVIVDKNLNFRSICPINESIFLENFSVEEMMKMYKRQQFYKNVFSFYLTVFSGQDVNGNPVAPFSLEDITVEKGEALGGFPYFQVPGSKAGLKWLPGVALGQVKKFNEGQQCSSSDEIEELTPQEKKVVADYYSRKKVVEELVSMGSLIKGSSGKLLLNTELLGIKESK